MCSNSQVGPTSVLSSFEAPTSRSIEEFLTRAWRYMAYCVRSVLTSSAKRENTKWDYLWLTWIIFQLAPNLWSSQIHRKRSNQESFWKKQYRCCSRFIDNFWHIWSSICIYYSHLKQAVVVSQSSNQCLQTESSSLKERKPWRQSVDTLLWHYWRPILH